MHATHPGRSADDPNTDPELEPHSTPWQATERRQAGLMHDGTSLRQQMHFGDYLRARAERGIGFREHLRGLGGAIEE